MHTNAPNNCTCHCIIHLIWSRCCVYDAGSVPVFVKARLPLIYDCIFFYNACTLCTAWTIKLYFKTGLHFYLLFRYFLGPTSHETARNPMDVLKVSLWKRVNRSCYILDRPFANIADSMFVNLLLTGWKRSRCRHL